jgi:type I restriction enzyme S subunit
MLSVSEPLRPLSKALPTGWRIQSFSEMLSEPVRNGVYKPKEFHGTGVRVVNMGELFGNEFISCQKMKRVELTPAETANFGLKDGDLLFARRSLIFEGSGKCSLLVNPVEPMTFESSIIRARPNPDIALPRFLFYLFSSPLGRAIMASIATRTAVSGIRGSDLSKLTLPIPPLIAQRRIVSVLLAYDDLIEINQRRVEILETTISALYREWFANFRFPGHDQIRRVPSVLGDIPNGWGVQRVDEICSAVLDGDWIETKDQGGDDYRLLQISNIGLGEFVETGNYRFVTRETFHRLHCNEILPSDILVARMPTPIGRAWLATPMAWKMITAVDVAILRVAPNRVLPSFLVQAWNQVSNLRRIAAQASGTTRLRITRRELAALEFVIPPIDLQARFDGVVSSMRALIQTMVSTIDVLRRTRDSLIPRLVLGQIELGPD